MEIKKMYETNEREKKRHYNERVQLVEHGSFSPLVFNALGGMARECSAVYKRLIEMIAEKRKQRVHLVTPWVRRKICFALMKAIIVCIRGTRNTWDRDDLVASISKDARDSETNTNIN